MNSNERSRKMDVEAGLEDYVRLSLCSIALKEGRISDPVLLKISLQVVSRPDVMFSNMNATHRKAKVGELPEVIRFDVKFNLRKFYQAEVLVSYRFHLT